MAEPGSAPAQQSSLLEVLWRRRTLIATCVLVAAAVGYLLSSLQQDRWTSSARVVLSSRGEFDPLRQGSFSNDPNRWVVQQGDVMTSTPVLDQVIADRELDVQAWQLREAVDIAATGDSDVLVVSVEDTDPARAQATADALVRAYRDFVAARVRSTVDRAVVQAASAQDVATIRTQGVVYGDGVALAEPASFPGDPTAPVPVRDAVLLGVLAGLVACVGALVADRRARRGGPPAQAGRLLSAPVVRDARSVAVALDLVQPQQGPVDRVLVAAARPGLEVAGTAAALAAACARDTRRTLHLRWDLVRERDLPRSAMTLAPIGPAGAGQLVHLPVHPVGQDGDHDLVEVIGGGVPAPDGLESVRDLVARGVAEADLVVVESGDLVDDATALALAGCVDAVVLVVDPDTTETDLATVAQRCGLAAVEVVAVVEVSRPQGRLLARWTGRGSGPAAPPAAPPAGPAAQASGLDAIVLDDPARSGAR